MREKPTYKELESILKDLEKEALRTTQVEKNLMSEVYMRNALLDNIPDCTAMILETGTREIFVSNESAQNLGAAPGRTCFNACSMRDNLCSWCLAPKLWETGQPQRTIFEDRGKSYEGVWAPLSEGLYVHYIFDISRSKQTEAALLKSETRLKALSDASFEAIFLSDKGICLDQTQTDELPKSCIICGNPHFFIGQIEKSYPNRMLIFCLCGDCYKKPEAGTTVEKIIHYYETNRRNDPDLLGHIGDS